jgi:ABC-type multidrug transport system fused ATPase/permease subunit
LSHLDTFALYVLILRDTVYDVDYCWQRVVVLKDQANKKAHEESAQMACEAAGAIRTVASLTREDDCVKLYSESLETPLRRSNRNALWSNLLYAVSQSTVFFVIALVFWYGSRLVSNQEFSTFQFFVGLMVCLLTFARNNKKSLTLAAEFHFRCDSSRQCILFRPGYVLREGCSDRYCQTYGLAARDRR